MGKLWSIALPWGWNGDGMRTLLASPSDVDARRWAGKIAGKIALKVNRKFIQIIPTANRLLDMNLYVALEQFADCTGAKGTG